MKDLYENKKLLLEKIQYEKYDWNICRDLNVICSLAWFAVWLHKVLMLSQRMELYGQKTRLRSKTVA